MKLSHKSKDCIYTAVWLFILLVYWVAIFCINFSKNPSLYNTDMYSDMIYATEVWTKKSLFPEGWVFGNQLYVVATPVLAALFCGLLHDPCIAMGIASTLMGFGVLISFTWMLKPIFVKYHERLAAAVFFMTLVLICGDSVFGENGWQLFFTMCSYYACYAIAAFLAFGCYLRSNSKWTTGFYTVLLLTCVFSFGTGIQSLRQTVIMVIPLIAVECLKFLYSIATKRKYSSKSMWIAGLLLISNVMGILFSKQIHVEKNEIFGDLVFLLPSDFLYNAVTSISTPFRLFTSYSTIAFILFAIICAGTIITIFSKKDWRDSHLFLCILLHIVSIAGILAIEITTTMYVREIYYFLLYPLAAIALAFAYSRITISRSLFAIIVLILTFTTSRQELQGYLHTPKPYYPIQQVSDYLEENEITTIYSHWNIGEKIAIASDFNIQVGFWDYSLDVFNSVKYLCNPSIFDMEAEEYVYVVKGEDTFTKANAVAQEQNISLNLMQYFPDFDFYVFSSEQRLMK